MAVCTSSAENNNSSARRSDGDDAMQTSVEGSTSLRSYTSQLLKEPQLQAKIKLLLACKICGTVEQNLQIYQRDSNNDPEFDLEVVCHNCLLRMSSTEERDKYIRNIAAEMIAFEILQPIIPIESSQCSSSQIEPDGKNKSGKKSGRRQSVSSETPSNNTRNKDSTQLSRRASRVEKTNSANLEEVTKFFSPEFNPINGTQLANGTSTANDSLKKSKRVRAYTMPSNILSAIAELEKNKAELTSRLNKCLQCCCCFDTVRPLSITQNINCIK